MAIQLHAADTATPDPEDRSQLVAAACLFRALGDPNRLAILRHLELGEHRVVDLTAHLGLAQSTVSKHLACLRDCGLVRSRAQGRASVFSLTEGAAVERVLRAAEQLLRSTGGAARTCAVTGAEAGAEVTGEEVRA